jgi:hypothetical protein
MDMYVCVCVAMYVCMCMLVGYYRKMNSKPINKRGFLYTQMCQQSFWSSVIAVD